MRCSWRLPLTGLQDPFVDFDVFLNRSVPGELFRSLQAFFAQRVLQILRRKQTLQGRSEVFGRGKLEVDRGVASHLGQGRGARAHYRRSRGHSFQYRQPEPLDARRHDQDARGGVNLRQKLRRHVRHKRRDLADRKSRTLLIERTGTLPVIAQNNQSVRNGFPGVEQSKSAEQRRYILVRFEIAYIEYVGRRDAPMTVDHASRFRPLIRRIAAAELAVDAAADGGDLFLGNSEMLDDLTL